MSEITEFSFILKPSKIEGIGIFTTHAISKGAFVSTNLLPKKRIIDFDQIHPEFHKFCVCKNKESCDCPKQFDTLDIWPFFLNHSGTPNVTIGKDKNSLIALRAIKAGEEICIDYNDFNESEDMKEEFCK